MDNRQSKMATMERTGRTVMMPMIMMVAMTLLLMPMLVLANTFQPQTKAQLVDAVNDYTANGALPNNVSISDWDTSLIDNMANLFDGKTTFNADISRWNTSSVTSISYIFQGASAFNQSINDWNVASVIYMRGVFRFATSFNGAIGDWNVVRVTNTYRMFFGASAFNQPIGDWNFVSAIYMRSMFNTASAFNQPIGNWNVSGVGSMWWMFKKAEAFNQPVGDWNVLKVTDFRAVFEEASVFNQPIGDWNLAGKTRMDDFFHGASAFNQPIGDWNVLKVTDFRNLFMNATAFNQPLCGWNVTKIVNFAQMFAGIPTSNFEAVVASTFTWDTTAANAISFQPACPPDATNLNIAASSPSTRCECAEGSPNNDALDNCGVEWDECPSSTVVECPTLPVGQFYATVGSCTPTNCSNAQAGQLYNTTGACTTTDCQGSTGYYFTTPNSCDQERITVDCTAYDIATEVLNGSTDVYGLLIPDETFDFLDAESVDVVVYMPADHGNDIELVCDAVNNTDGISSTSVSSQFPETCTDENVHVVKFTMGVAQFSENQYEVEGGFETVYTPTCRLVEQASGILISRITKQFIVTMDNNLAFTVSSTVLEETIDVVEVEQDINELVELVMTPPIFQDGQVIVLDYDLSALNADAEGVFEIVSIDSLTLSLSEGAEFNGLSTSEVALAQQTETETGYAASFLLPSSAYVLDTPQSVVISAEVTIGLYGETGERRRRTLNYVGDSLTLTTNGFAAGGEPDQDYQAGSTSDAMASAPTHAGALVSLVAVAMLLV